MRVTGKLVSWRDEQGFGFIAPETGGPNVFVHIKSFFNHNRRPLERDVVTFEHTMDANGRPQAVNVAFDGEPQVTPSLVPFPILFACVFLIAMAALAYTDKLPTWVAGLYAAASAVAFVGYWGDKDAARNNRRRTPENTLLFLGIIGGWPGAILAQQAFRHKTQKPSFQAAFWISVVVNCGVLLFLASPSLRAYIRLLGEGW